MKSNGVDVWLEGERELFVNMQRRLDGCTDAARRGMQKAGTRIVEDAKRNLADNGSMATGQLRASGRVQAVEGDADAVDAGFFSQNTRGGYAFFVEYGRRRGKMPPVDEIVAWLRKKTSVRSGIKSAFASAAAFSRMKQGAYLQHLAWAIAKAIAKAGTTPHPFFGPAVEKNKNAVKDFIAEEVNKETQRDGK